MRREFPPASRAKPVRCICLLGGFTERGEFFERGLCPTATPAHCGIFTSQAMRAMLDKIFDLHVISFRAKPPNYVLDSLSIHDYTMLVNHPAKTPLQLNENDYHYLTSVIQCIRNARDLKRWRDEQAP